MKSDKQELPKMITTKDAAELVGVARVTILKWIDRKHLLQSVKFGRDWMVNRDEVAKFAKSHNPKAGRPARKKG